MRCGLEKFQGLSRGGSGERKIWGSLFLSFIKEVWDLDKFLAIMNSLLHFLRCDSFN
jgi:hypothetical protein